MLSKELSILIVEDDLSFSIELQMLIKEIGYNVLAAVDNSAEALECIYAEQPDLILMDIDIKGKLTGLEIAEKIDNLSIPILFISSIQREEIYERAKKTNFIGYMVKPLGAFSLRSSIELAIRSLPAKELKETKSDFFPFKKDLFFKQKGIFKKIVIEKINYIEANGNYSVTVTNNEKLISSISLSELEKILEGYPFMRIHRRYLINLQKITYLDTVKNQLIIADQVIPISRTKKNSLIEYIQLIQ